MKKLFSAMAAALALSGTTASAADLAVKSPMPMPALVIFSWSGCYVGAEGGGNWGRSEQIARSGAFLNSPITGKFDLSGGMAGGTVGCNFQTSNFVFGIENDFSWTNKRGSVSDLPPFIVTSTSATREKWIDTLRPRFGYAWDKFLVYGTAGVAFAGTDVTVSNPAFGSITNSQTRIGWTAGVGGEWAAWTGPWGAVTFKLEYLHADFDSKQYFIPPVATPVGTIVTRDMKLRDDMVRVGMNFLFNWGGPVIAKY